MELQLTSFETAIKNHLDNLAKEDSLFAEKYAKSGKSISECCKYIYQQVEKSRKNNERCVACSSEEVFGLAVHYYDEDDIKVDGPSVPVNAVAQPSGSPEPPQPSAKPKERKRKPKAKEVIEDPDLPEELEIPLF